MTSLKCWNSGVESNAGSFINLPSLTFAPAFLTRLARPRVRSTRFDLTELAGEFLVRNAPSDNLFHDAGEAFGIAQLAMVESKRLLITIACKWKGSTEIYVPFSARLSKLQKFSKPFV